MTPRLILGGNVFGWTVNGADAFAVLDRFAEAGGVLIDTAENYGGGQSEDLIGEWIRRRGRRDDVLISSKVGLVSELTKDGIANAIDASLKRLGIDTIDLYVAHRDDPAIPMEETLAAFDRLLSSGKVRAIGASNYSAQRLSEALAISDRNGLARYSALLTEYSLLERGAFEQSLRQVCLANNVGVLAYYGIAQGFLTDKYRSLFDLSKSERGPRIAKYLNARGFSVLAALEETAAAVGATPAQIALVWVTAQAGVTAAIASATSVTQINELLGSMMLHLNNIEIDRLNAATGLGASTDF